MYHNTSGIHTNPQQASSFVSAQHYNVPGRYAGISALISFKIYNLSEYVVEGIKQNRLILLKML